MKRVSKEMAERIITLGYDKTATCWYDSTGHLTCDNPNGTRLIAPYLEEVTEWLQIKQGWQIWTQPWCDNGMIAWIGYFGRGDLNNYEMTKAYWGNGGKDFAQECAISMALDLLDKWK